MTTRPPRPDAARLALEAFTRFGGRAEPGGGQGTRLRVLAALLLVPAVSMCGGPPEVTQTVPPPTAPIEAVRPPEPDTTLAGEVRRAEALLADADVQLRQGVLDQASEGYRRVMHLHRASDPEFPRELRARALWGDAVTRLIALEPNGDTAPTKTLLQALVTSYDGTVEAQQARWAMAALAEIEKLRAQSVQKDEDIRRLNEAMEQLKRIDLGRRPNSPPEP